MRRFESALLIAAGLAIAFTGHASAARPRVMFVSCEMVRAYAAQVGADELERLARERGATEAQVAAGRRCLSPVKRRRG